MAGVSPESLLSGPLHTVWAAATPVGVTTRSGCKWAANTAMEWTVSSLKLQDIIGNQCAHQQGIGSAHFQSRFPFE